MMKAAGIEDVVGFDYMDVPDRAAIVSALEQLYALQALGDDGKLTDTGKRAGRSVDRNGVDVDKREVFISTKS